MKGKTHMIIGATTGIALALATHAQHSDGLLMIVAGAFGALLPDIDSPESTISRNARPVRLFVFWLPHRTLTHSVIPLIALALVTVATAAGMIGWALTAGYASHIAADMTTRRGVPLFYPLWRRNFHLLPPGFRLTTGGVVESFFGLACTAGCLYLIALFLNVLPVGWRI